MGCGEYLELGRSSARLGHITVSPNIKKILQNRVCSRIYRFGLHTVSSKWQINSSCLNLLMSLYSSQFHLSFQLLVPFF